MSPHLHSCRLALCLRRGYHQISGYSFIFPGRRHCRPGSARPQRARQFRFHYLARARRLRDADWTSIPHASTCTGLPREWPLTPNDINGLSTVCIWLLKSLICVSTRNSRAINVSFISPIRWPYVSTRAFCTFCAVHNWSLTCRPSRIVVCITLMFSTMARCCSLQSARVLARPARVRWVSAWASNSAALYTEDRCDEANEPVILLTRDTSWRGSPTCSMGGRTFLCFP